MLFFSISNLHSGGIYNLDKPKITIIIIELSKKQPLGNHAKELRKDIHTHSYNQKSIKVLFIITK